MELTNQNESQREDYSYIPGQAQPIGQHKKE